MQCSRCGAAFDGHFCPRCGAPAPASSTPSAAWPCARCGTLHAGNFCPRCGLPRAYAYVPPAVPSGAGARSVLSVLWTFAIVVVVVLAAFDFVALALTPGVVVPGIQGIAGGSTTNPGFDVSAAGWSFFGIGSPAAAGVWRASGGNPDGYLETRLLPGTNVVGYWTQTFEVSGSVPFVGELQLDIDVTPGSLTPEVRLHAYVSRIPGIPDASSRIGSAIFAARTVWQSSLEIPADDPFAGPGTYHLTIEVAADSSAAG